MTHAKCLSPYSLDGVFCVWKNEGVIKTAIKTMKYDFADDLAKILAKYLIIELRKGENSLVKDAVLTPVPLHPRKLKWRGFNQSEEIGKHVAKFMGYEFSQQILKRVKDNKSQADLDKEARLTNMRGVFSINKKLKIINQKSVIIFDDVWTTGATLREAGKVLKRKGAEKVWGLTIAH